MPKHFLFESGQWLGAGQINFSESPDLLYFRTKWEISTQDSANYHCVQTVEIVGGDSMINVFSVTPKDADTFDITIENELLGVFAGTGVIEDKLVAWEFRLPGQLEGYEVYNITPEQEYNMQAEYISGDGARTTIRGKIWKSKTQGEIE